jgi:hypothetical protein
MGSALMQMLSGNQQQAPKKEGENGGPFPQQPPQAVMSNQQQLAKVLAGNPAALQMLSPDSLLQAWGVAEAMDRSLTSAAQQAFQNERALREEGRAEQGLALDTISTADRLATGDVSRKATLQDMNLAEKREGRDEEEHTKRMAAFNQSFEASQRALDDQIRQSEQQITIEKTYASIAGMPYEEGEARARLQTQRNLKTGSPEDAAKMVDRVAMYIDVYLDAHKDLDDPALRQLQQDISLDVPQTNEFMLMSPEEQAQALRARKLNMTSYIERMKTHPAVQQAVALAKAEIDAGAEPNTASMAEMRNLTTQTQTAAAGTPGEGTGADKGAKLTATQLEGMIGAETVKKKVEPQGSSYPSTKMEGRSSYSAPSVSDPFAKQTSPNTIQGSPKPMDTSYVFELLRKGVLSVGLVMQKIMDLPPEAQEETLRLLNISHKDFMAMPEEQRKAYLHGRLQAVKGE